MEISEMPFHTAALRSVDRDSRRRTPVFRAWRPVLWTLCKILLFLAVLAAFWALLPALAHGQKGAEQKSPSSPPIAGGGPRPPAPDPVTDESPEAVAEPPLATDEAEVLETGDPIDPEPLGAPRKRAVTAPVPDDAADAGRELDYLELAWRLEILTPNGNSDPAAGERDAFTTRLYEIALAASAAAGLSDNPRAVLSAISTELFERRGFEVVEFEPLGSEDPPWELVAPAAVLELRRGTPRTVGVLFLTIAEMVRPGLDLKFAQLPGAGLIRFRSADYVASVLLAPGREGEDWPLEKIERLFELSDSQKQLGLFLADLGDSQLEGLILHDFGRLALAAGDRDRARELLLESRRRYGEWPATSLELAKLARRDREFEPALDHVRAARNADPFDSDVLRLEGELLRELGAADLALQAYLRLLEVVPEESSAIHRTLGDIQLESGRWRDALSHYREAAAHERDAGRSEELEGRVRELAIYEELEVLRGREDYAGKFRALRRIARRPSSIAVVVLIDVLEDDNQRLARYAWKVLRDVTGEDIEFSRDAWRRWYVRKRGGEGSNEPEQPSVPESPHPGLPKVYPGSV